MLEIRADKYNRSFVKLTERTIPLYPFQIWQGPAFKAIGKSGMMEQDYVWVFRHKNVTACLKQWFQGQRWYNWPNKHLIDLCMSLGYLLVKDGHRKSDEYDLEWRISFSLQERLIVTNFNSGSVKQLHSFEVSKEGNNTETRELWIIQFLSLQNLHALYDRKHTAWVLDTG